MVLHQHNPITLAAFTRFFVIPGSAHWLSRLAAICGPVASLCFMYEAYPSIPDQAA